MQVLVEIGIAWIIALQAAFGDWFIAPMRFFSYLGTEEFFLVVLPAIYWSVDSALGLRVGLVLVSSNLFNYAAKLVFTGPRPYWVSSQTRALWLTETTFGIPSGHAQLAASVWGMVAAYFKRPWVRIGALPLIFFIGFSRIYLGAHFPHDVLFGWLLGGLVLWAFVSFWNPVGAWAERQALSRQVLAAFLASLVFIVLCYGTWLWRSGYQIPEEWIKNALLAGAAEPEPVDANGIFTSAGTLFGLAAGAAWIRSRSGFSVSASLLKDPLGRRVLRYLIGLAGVLVLYLGLGAVFPRGDAPLFYLLRYLRYAFIGFWVAGGAPWIFVRFRLVEG